MDAEGPLARRRSYSATTADTEEVKEIEPEEEESSVAEGGMAAGRSAASCGECGGRDDDARCGGCPLDGSNKPFDEPSCLVPQDSVTTFPTLAASEDVDSGRSAASPFVGMSSPAVGGGCGAEGEGGGGGSSSGRASNLFNRLVRRSDVNWDDDEEDGGDDDVSELMGFPCDDDAGDEFRDNGDVEKGGGSNSRKKGRMKRRRTLPCLTAHYRRRCLLSTAKFVDTLRRRRRIPLIALLTFAALCASGLAAVRFQAREYVRSMKSVGNAAGRDAVKWFGDEFDRALLPLFTLAQIAKHDAAFRDLARRIGNRGEEGSAPGWPGRENELRDVRGICDDPELVARFADVAESVRRDSGLGPALSNLRLAPMGVMCLIHPVINHDDYPGNMYHNVTKRLYNDWATDVPRHMDAMEKVMQSQESDDVRVVVSGPFKPKSAAGDGRILTNTLFCPKLGVSVPDHHITVRNNTYESWGFVMGFMNWEVLVEQSQMHERFEELGMMFRLNRTTWQMDRENPYTYYQDTHVLAESRQGCVDDVTESDRVTVSMTVNGDPWTLTAGFECGFRPPWQTAAEVAVVLISLAGSLLLLLVLVEKAQHKELLYRMMPRSAVRKLNRGQAVVEKYDEPVTVFFSDIVGFTAMAGEMRPVQVMRMLNELYSKFDKLVERHGLYKVETVADAYMVLGGAPDRLPGREAARRVAKFALDAVKCVNDCRFGDKEERLFVRAGLASGPIAAGVIGTDKPRYCLFGDTCNLASRMESTSEAMRIQCSDSTARLLRESSAGEGDGGGCEVFDLAERRSADGRRGVDVKGKGWTRTWWIEGVKDAPPRDVSVAIKAEGTDRHRQVGLKRRGTEASMESADFSQDITTSSKAGCLSCAVPWKRKKAGPWTNGGERRTTPLGKNEFLRLNFQSNKLSWTKILLEANEKASSAVVAESLSKQHWTCLGNGRDPLNAATDHAGVMIDRMAALLERRLIALYESRGKAGGPPASAVRELRDYVAEIETHYNKVHYHSFEHISHVTVSANKLIEIMLESGRGRSASEDGKYGAPLHLRSDALAHFALVFAAFVHDVEHRGVSNKMLSSDRDLHELVARYGGKSVAERNSIDVAMRILSKPDYAELRQALTPGGDEQDRVTFEQIVRGTVLCTDIADGDRMAGCKRRWERAFAAAAATNAGAEGSCEEVSGAEFDCETDSEPCHGVGDGPSHTSRCPFPYDGPAACLRSCVVLEHMIQIADVAHTMQGWGNFLKWNYRLFRELYACHRAGLMPDPAPGWADGQVSFLEGYVLPLAERMERTGALGSHGPRLLRRARENCARWAEAGKEIAILMANGIATDEAEERTLQMMLLRAFRAGEKSLLWDDDASETDDSNIGNDDSGGS